jgi:hypothetical protein
MCGHSLRPEAVHMYAALPVHAGLEVLPIGWHCSGGARAAADVTAGANCLPRLSTVLV